MENTDIHRFDAIIDLPRPHSKSRKPMSMRNRAAQFAPFAALTGYDDAVRETARLNEERVEGEESSTIFLNTTISDI